MAERFDKELKRDAVTVPRRISRKLDGWRFYRGKRVRTFGKRTSFMKAWNERSGEFEQGSIRQVSRRISRTERSAKR